MAFSPWKAHLARWIINFTEYWRIKEIRRSPLIHTTVNIAHGVIITDGVKIGRKSFVNGPGTFIDSGTIDRCGYSG